MMITRNLSLSLILATLALSWPAIALAQQSKIIRFAPSDCKTAKGERPDISGTLSIYMNDQSILFESSPDGMPYLLTDEGLIGIVHKVKVYSILSYDELKAEHSRQVDKAEKHLKDTGKWPSMVELRMTDETATISGLSARKLIKINGDKLEAEIWVSSELVPIRLRERMKSIYPEDYWKKVDWGPSLIDIIMQYGIPLKTVGEKNSGFLDCKAQVLDGATSDKSFQVPPGYGKIEK
jgi:hypothetical protein